MNTNEVYHKYLSEVLFKGVRKAPSRGQEFGTIEAFGSTTPMVFDLSLGVPVISTKQIWMKGIIGELLWFLSGDTNIRTLRKQGIHIWDDNAYDFFERGGGELSKESFFKAVDEGISDEFGDLGRMYGYQWRRKLMVDDKGGVVKVDPLLRVISKLYKSPDSREIILDTYDNLDVDYSALPPCHTMPLFFNCTPLTISERKVIAEGILHETLYDYNDELFEDLNIPKYRLNSEMIQRSGDSFLGVPFNITSTALMTLLIADIVNMVPGIFTHHVINAHIYLNHIEQVTEQLKRDTSVKSSFDYSFVWGESGVVPEDIKVGYETSYGKIKAKMVV